MADVFDELLSLEEKYYQDGYNEGLEDGNRTGYHEGIQFGIQTGYQRFLLIGLLQGRLVEWRKKKDDRLDKHLNQLEAMIADIPMTNSDENVEVYEKMAKKARAKVKVISALLSKQGDYEVDYSIAKEKLELKSTEETIEDI
ncbi:protein Lto1p [Trichomonascus vanleenenianus]|uniref:ribosome biosynthesis protein LTO1 n=1 Tax=Trichomonascus vanleenenianus TaxID=2268995 RepID=UPI003ECAB560